MRLLTAPTAEPVTLDQVKFAARLTGSTAFDAMLPVYMQAAREIAEAETRTRWMSQKWRVERYDWPGPCDVLELAGATAVEVSYWGSTSAWVTMDSGTFVWADADPGVVIGALVGQAWPTLGDIAAGPRVRVDITVGTVDASAVPAAVKTFIMAMVAYWVDNPQAYTDKPHVATPAALALLDSQRVAY